MRVTTDYEGPLRPDARLDELIWFHLEMLREDHKRMDPVAIIEAFMFAVDAGYSPPEWVIRDVYKVFNHYHNEEGTISLDVLFGLKSKGRGKSPALKKRNRDDRMYHLCWLVWRLKTFFSISIGDAAYMVNVRETRLGNNPPNESCIEENYRKIWRKRIEANIDFIKDEKDRFSHEEARQAFLGSFPSEASYGLK